MNIFDWSDRLKLHKSTGFVSAQGLYFVTFAIVNILLKVEMAKRTLMAETFDIFVVLAFRQFFHRQLSIILTMVKMAKKAKTKMKKMA